MFAPERDRAAQPAAVRRSSAACRAIPSGWKAGTGKRRAPHVCTRRNLSQMRKSRSRASDLIRVVLLTGNWS